MVTTEASDVNKVELEDVRELETIVYLVLSKGFSSKPALVSRPDRLQLAVRLSRVLGRGRSGRDEHASSRTMPGCILQLRLRSKGRGVDFHARAPKLRTTRPYSGF
jgi:hypothetical protein